MSVLKAILALSVLRNTVTDDFYFKKSLVFGYYNQRMLEKRISVPTLQQRWVDHPCHGCYCRQISNEHLRKGKFGDNALHQLGIFDTLFYPKHTFYENHTASGCLNSPKEQYIGNPGFCKIVSRKSTEHVYSYYRCCEDLCHRYLCASAIPGIDQGNVSYSLELFREAKAHCDVTDAHVDYCRCALSSTPEAREPDKPALDMDRDCVVTAYNHSVELLDERFMSHLCVVYLELFCRLIS